MQQKKGFGIQASEKKEPTADSRQTTVKELCVMCCMKEKRKSVEAFSITCTIYA
jgi:hypothetical protein